MKHIIANIYLKIHSCKEIGGSHWLGMCSWAILPFVRQFLQDLSTSGGCGMGLIPEKERLPLAGLGAVPRSLPGHPAGGTSHLHLHPHHFSQDLPPSLSLGFTFQGKNFLVASHFPLWECVRSAESLIASFLITLYSPFPLPASLRRANPAEVGEQDFPQKERFFFWDKDIRHSLSQELDY